MNHTPTYPSIVAIVLAWNSADCIARSLQSLTASTVPVEVIVIDNDSHDATERVVRTFANVTYHNTQANLGYAGGNNVGIRMAQQRGAEYVFVLNPDAYIAPDCIAKLVDVVRQDAGVGIVSPKIYYADSTTLWFAGATLDWKTGASPHVGQGQPDGPAYAANTPLPRANGCAMLVRMSDVEQVGLLDERYFLYFEETDWSVRWTAAGKRIMFVADAYCWHAASTSTGGYFAPLYQYYTTRNSLLLVRTHHRQGWPLFVVRHLFLSIQRVYRTLRNRPQNTGGVIRAICKGYIDFVHGRFGYRKI